MKKKIISLIKLLILAGIFYAILAFNVFHLGEKLVPSSKDYLKENIPTEDMNIEENFFEAIPIKEETGHFAAKNRYEIMLENMCNKVNICNKLYFNGEYSIYEEYSYTKAIATLVDFIDKNGSQPTPIKTVINEVEINKDTGKRRGYATWDTIIFNLGSVSSKKEFAELVTHEMGHITDLGYIQGTSSKKDKNYTEFGKVVFAINDLSLGFYKISRDNETIRKAEAKKKDFCSGYGMSDPFEDFSECFNLYLNHNMFFREIAAKNTILKKKYNFVAGLVKGKYIASNSQELSLIKDNNTRRPRDTTKLTNN